MAARLARGKTGTTRLQRSWWGTAGRCCGPIRADRRTTVTKFGAANKNDLGGGDYQDVMAGVDAVLAKYPLDPNRMALMGYSYGGEMAGFVEGKTDRFKAIISGAPVIDQFSEYGTEGGSWYDRWYYGKPWEHMEDAWRQSPLSGAARKAKTPFHADPGRERHHRPAGPVPGDVSRAAAGGRAGGDGAPIRAKTTGRWQPASLAGPSPEPWHGYDGRQRIVEFIEKAFGEAH
jgi:hypothetical protein